MIGAEVLIMDRTTRQIVGRVPVGYGPEVVLAPTGDRLYVFSSLRTGSALAIIDTTQSVMARAAGAFLAPPDGLRVIMTNGDVSA